FVREPRLGRPLGRVRRGEAAALRHPSGAATRRERLLWLCGAPQAVPRGRPGVLAHRCERVSDLRERRVRAASGGVRILRAARVHRGSGGAGGSGAARAGSPSAPLLHLRAACRRERSPGGSRGRRPRRGAPRGGTVPRRAASGGVRILRAARVHRGSGGAGGSGAARAGSPSAPLLHLRAACRRERSPGGSRGGRPSRDAQRGEIVPSVADGARPQSPGRGARSRADAESGIHAATRGERAGQRREAFVARIEAAEVNPIRSASLLVVLTGALAPAVPARAQTIPPSAYGALRWRLIGPHRGGRVLAVAGVSGDPATFYFGSVDGGVWRTRNAGVTWEPL